MIDLHTHSTASDGTLTPRALVDLAAAKGLEALALTDHDTLAGIPEAAERARQVELTFVPGIELGASCDGLRDIHVLGYYVVPGDLRLAGALSWLRSCRWTRAQRIVARLNELGVDLTFDQVRNHVTSDSVGRPHVARALVEAGHASSLGEAFRRWLVPGAPAYVEKPHLTMRQVIDLIRGVGGIAVLAHPATLKLDPNELRGLLLTLSDQGLQGIEAHWSKHEWAEACLYEEMANRLGLLVTGGSDFHGSSKPEIELGLGAGKRKLPLQMFKQLQQRWKSQQP